MKILFTGGGTGGSIMPLVAVAQACAERFPNVDILFVRSQSDVEQRILEDAGFRARGFPGAKLRRYADWRNIRDVFILIYAFFKAAWLLSVWRPNVVVGAGGYLSVPVMWVARLLGVPTIAHQQDLEAGLANKLVAPFATTITTAFETSLKDFPSTKTQWIGNPVRTDILRGDAGRFFEAFQLPTDVPLVFVLGGSTGAQGINNLVTGALQELTKFCVVVHVLGERPMQIAATKRYHPIRFLKRELADAYAAATLVVTRAGLSTLSELSAVEKPVVIIPMPNTHQEANANYFAQQDAAVVLNQTLLTPQIFAQEIHTLLKNDTRRQTLAANLRRQSKMDATAVFVHLLEKYDDSGE